MNASWLSFAIVRPVALTDADGTGAMRFGDEVDVGGEAPRGDVSIALADALVDDDRTGKALRVQSA